MNRAAAAFAAITIIAAPLARAATCPDGTIAMYVSGRGELCPDASGRYTVPVGGAAPAVAPMQERTPVAGATFDLSGNGGAPKPPAPPAAALPSGGAVQSGNVRLLQACRNLYCNVQEGYQPGLTTVEVLGHAPQYAGRSLDLTVGDMGTQRQVERRKVGVMVNGDYTTSIAAYKLLPGQYVFVFRPIGANDTLGLGAFAVGEGGNVSTPAVKPQPSRAGGRSSSAGVVGTWQGVGGTMGKIELHPDGTYTSNRAPAGRYQVSGNQVTFTGNLAAWNGGHATLKRPDLMEFYWKSPSGGINYFAFAKY